MKQRTSTIAMDTEKTASDAPGCRVSSVAVSATVVALCHSAVYRVHRDRIRGFSDYFADQPHEGLEFRFVAFGQDDRSISARRIAEVFETWPDLAGRYNVGGGNLGVLDALLTVGRSVFFVGHELNDQTRAALIAANANVILDQLPEEQARRADRESRWPQ